MHQVERMIESLRDGHPIKLVLTNVRKDGSWFLNLLALQPVYNRDNEYSFVIGISYDIAQARNSSFHRNESRNTHHLTSAYLGANHR